ncbi:MAG: phosphotransferase family protein [Acidimicrobiales bacterium]
MESSAGSTGADQADAWALLERNGIDSRWLTTELARAGFAGQITWLEPELVGTGQVGENVRCRLGWDGASTRGEPDDGGPTVAHPGRPRSVVVKLASANEASRAAAEATRTYIREVGFYRDVAPSVAIRVPTAYHVSEDRPANRFILVMEDIAPADAGNQLAGCTTDQASLAIDAAADLHGSTWGRTDLAGLEWIDEPTPTRTAERVELFRLLYPGFVDRYRQRLDADHLAFGRWLESKFDRWVGARAEPQCLVHGDFRLDNMLFGTGSPAPPLTTVDWQTPSLGGGLADVAYFLSGSLDRQALRDHEAEYLARYRTRLAGHGVELSEAMTWTDYRLSAPAGFVMAVIASQLVGQTDRGDDMFMVMAAGSAAQALDLDTAKLID